MTIQSFEISIYSVFCFVTSWGDKNQSFVKKKLIFSESNLMQFDRKFHKLHQWILFLNQQLNSQKKTKSLLMSRF